MQAGTAACVAAAIVVPALFDPRADRAFDEAKVVVLRAVAAFGAAALFCQAAVHIRRRSRIPLPGRRATALVCAVALLTVAYLTATLLSVAPAISWQGAYIRRQGLLTFLSYIVFFLTTAWFLRASSQRRVLLVAMLLASVCPTAYAICQRFGLDLIEWHNPAPERVTSTAGNPIFLGSYLIMVWPLAIAEIVRARHNRVAITCCGLLAAGQIAAMVFTGSVSIGLALAVEILVLGTILLTTVPHVRTRAVILTIALIGAAALGVVASARRPVRLQTSIDTATGDGPSRSGEVRLLLWRSAVDLVRQKPERALVGYGPDTTRSILGRFDPVALRRLEGRATADRSHNFVLDTLLTIGIFGLLAQTVIAAGLCLYLLRDLGLLTSRKDAALLACSVALFVVVCLGAAYSADRRGGLLTLGWSGGLLAGVLAFVVGRAVVSRQMLEIARTMPASALLAALIGHFVEMQTGIATPASELYFWLFAGLIAGAPADAGSPKGSAAADTDERATAAGTLSTTIMSAAIGLTLGLITFEFAPALVTSPVLPPFSGFVGALILIAASFAVSTWQARLRFLITSAGLWLTVPAVSGIWARLHARELVPSGAEAASLMSRSGGLAGGMFATTFAACAVLALSQRKRRPALLAVALSVPCVLIVAVTNLNALRADELSHIGTSLMSVGRWVPAEWFYARAASLQPACDAYLARLGEAALAEFRGGARTDTSRLPAASQAYSKAHDLNPLEPDYLLQLAAIQSLWAAGTPAGEQRHPHLQEADRYLAAAADLAPRDPLVWNDWGKIRLREADYAGAAAIFERSLALDVTSPDTHLLYADALVGTNRYEDAVREYDTARRLGLMTPLPAISGKALALVHMNRLSDAIDANMDALRVAPEDYVTRKNLAMLYEQTGDVRHALSFAVAAAAVADASSKPAIEAFVAELRARAHEHPGTAPHSVGGPGRR